MLVSSAAKSERVQICFVGDVVTRPEDSSESDRWPLVRESSYSACSEIAGPVGAEAALVTEFDSAFE